MANNPIIKIESLSKHSAAGNCCDCPDDINLSIYPGEIFGIIGLFRCREKHPCQMYETFWKDLRQAG